MQSDDSLPFELDDVVDVCARSEVVVVGFPLFAERLLLDGRSSLTTGTMLRVVPPVASRAERMRDLARLRPEFGVPDNHVFFVWPRSLASFRASGIWDALARRMAGNPDDVDRQLATALDELRSLELRSLQEAVAGESYQTLWTRSA